MALVIYDGNLINAACVGWVCEACTLGICIPTQNICDYKLVKSDCGTVNFVHCHYYHEARIQQCKNCGYEGGICGAN